MLALVSDGSKSLLLISSSETVPAAASDHLRRTSMSFIASLLAADVDVADLVAILICLW